jgi:hypothetical protein
MGAKDAKGIRQKVNNALARRRQRANGINWGANDQNGGKRKLGPRNRPTSRRSADVPSASAERPKRRWDLQSLTVRTHQSVLERTFLEEMDS